MTDENKTLAAPDDKGPILRIVPSGEDKANDKDRPGKNNPFVKFMSAYADAIDDEIKAILDL